jgi:hypothetical protein
MGVIQKPIWTRILTAAAVSLKKTWKTDRIRTKAQPRTAVQTL